MFGFLRPAQHDLAYRQLYARCCQHQRQVAGLSSLPLLSYEAVFLYALAMDAGWFAPPDAQAPACCRLRRRTDAPSKSEVAVADFAVAFGLLLASIKVEDDVTDDGSWLARIVRWKLSPQFRAARTYFQTLDDQFETRIGEFLNQHAQLEQTCRHAVIPLQDYVQPTAQAFGYVFSLAARIARVDLPSPRYCRGEGSGVRGIHEAACATSHRSILDAGQRDLGSIGPLLPLTPSPSPQITGARGAATFISADELFLSAPRVSGSNATWLTSIGQNVGAAIIAFDCAVDWETDQKRGRCNPLPDQSAAEAALQESRLFLAQAGWHGDSQLLASAVTTRLLLGLCHRLENTQLPWQRRATRKARWQNWGLLGQPGYTFARCDCIVALCEYGGPVACEGLCAGAECCAAGEGAAAGADCCVGCGSCGADCCVITSIDSCCGTTSSQQKSDESETKVPDPPHTYRGITIGDHGFAKTALGPTGYVQVNRQKLLAQAEVGFISESEPVEVIELRSFGVVVRKIAT